MKLHGYIFIATFFTISAVSAIAQNLQTQQQTQQEHQGLIQDENKVHEYLSKEEAARKRGDTKEAQIWREKRYQAQQAAGIEQGRLKRDDLAEDKHILEKAQQALVEDQKQVADLRNQEEQARRRGDVNEAKRLAELRYQAQQAAGIEQGRINRGIKDLQHDQVTH